MTVTTEQQDRLDNAVAVEQAPLNLDTLRADLEGRKAAILREIAAHGERRNQANAAIRNLRGDLGAVERLLRAYEPKTRKSKSNGKAS